MRGRERADDEEIVRIEKTTVSLRYFYNLTTALCTFFAEGRIAEGMVIRVCSLGMPVVTVPYKPTDTITAIQNNLRTMHGRTVRNGDFYYQGQKLQR